MIETHITNILVHILDCILYSTNATYESTIYDKYPLYGRMFIEYLHNNQYINIDLYGRMTITSYGMDFIAYNKKL